MSKASRKVKAKRRAKARPQRRRSPSYGDNVAALALTADDLVNLRWCIAALECNQRVECKCPKCEAQQVHYLTDLREAAGFLVSLLSKLGDGASLWFQKG